MVDDRDRDGLMRTFEALLGLPDGLLVPAPDTANRSLTLAETEMLRRLNREFRGNGLPDELYSRPVRNGAVMHMKNTCRPAPGDARISTPPWALETAAGIGAEMAHRITRMGVRVLGNPALLSPPLPSVSPDAGPEEVPGAPAIAPEVPHRPCTERSRWQPRCRCGRPPYGPFSRPRPGNSSGSSATGPCGG